MNRIIATSLAITLCASSLITNSQPVRAEDAKQQQGWKLVPKELSPGVKKGLQYLVSQQNADGSWSQGEESQYMRTQGQKNGDIHNVADTCMAAMAVLRAGSLPNSGPYAKNMEKAVNYVCSSIESSDQNSLFITPVRGTRVQVKLGQYVDTFLASVFLPDVKGKMPDRLGNDRVAAALDKVIYKIEKNQSKDGDWASDGWAPIHSKSLALQGLNKSKRVGQKVNLQSLAAAELSGKMQFNRATKGFSGAGSANVPLYSAAASIGGLQKAVEANRDDEAKYTAQFNDTKSSPDVRRKAKENLDRIKDTLSVQQDQLSTVTAKLADKGFVQGFGCNGGEEFLSYMQISDTLIANKSKEWESWDKKMTTNLGHVQQGDGSWMGQHCITSRTFCTAAALLVLTADRGDAKRNIASSARGQVK